MKSIVYYLILVLMISLPGCESDSSEFKDALERAEKAERKVTALQEALAALKNEKTVEDLNDLQVVETLERTKEDLIAANQTLVDLQVQETELEHKLKKAMSTSEYLRKEIAARDQDIKDLDQLNRDLSKALEQLEKELQSLENNTETVDLESVENPDRN